ncbi:MAG: O-antigen ligase family protein [Pseudomonadales bacterium]|nr:O-antigen ligase family protein [Pseudomonadales bacterium]
MILLYGVFLGGTRGVWIGFLAAGTVAVFMAPHLTRQVKTYLLIAGIVVLTLVSGIVWYTDYHEELLRRSTSFRPEIWSTFWNKIITGNTLFGAGANAGSEIQPGPYVFDHPHNIYVATLYYGGVIGLLLLLAMLAFAIYGALQLRDPSQRNLILTCLTFSLIALAFDGDRLLVKVDYSWVLFWLPLAMVLSVRPYEGNRQETSTSKVF